MKKIPSGAGRALFLAWLAARHLLALLIPARLLPGPRLSKPERLRSFFESAGGAFIKLGQLLALQPDILPLEYCNELYDLLDRVEPCDFADIEQVFESELGRKPREVFDYFGAEPISTASIGQVHIGIRNGARYAVKVRRAGADAEFHRDIQLMTRFMRWLEILRLQSFHWLRSPISEFIEWTAEELDYRQEARYMDEIRHHAEDQDHIYVPAIDWELTTRRTLVVEFLEGVTVADYLRAQSAGDASLRRGLERHGFDPQIFSRHIVDNFLRDAFVHGLFHADLHPANLMILPGNVVGYIDFGITGALSVHTRRRLASLTIAWSLGDLDELVEAFFSLTRPPSAEQSKAYRDGLRELASSWYGMEGGRRRLVRSFTLVMLEMLGLSHRTGIMPDREVTKYLRSAIASDGLIKRFAPGMDVTEELEAGSRRYLKSILIADLFSFENFAAWGGMLERFFQHGKRDPGPTVSSSEHGSDPARGQGLSQALALALISFVFAIHGSLFGSFVDQPPVILAAEAAISGMAGISAVRSWLQTA